MPPIRPWWAAGAEKPMRTVSPASSLGLAASPPPPPPPPEASGVLLVQPATRTPAPRTANAVDVTRRNGRCLAADMFSPRVIASLAVVGQVVGRAGGAGPGRVPSRTASGAVGRRAGRGAAG